MLTKIQIVMIVVALIAVAVAVYFLTRPKDDTPQQPQQPQQQKSGIKKLLDDVLGVFGVKTKENFKLERFTNPANNTSTTTNATSSAIFKTINDIPKNMPTFIKYAFPKINMDEINNILKENNVGKTAYEIFAANTTKPYALFEMQFNIIDLLENYSGILYDETDDDELLNGFRLLFFIMTIVLSLKAKSEIPLPGRIDGTNDILTEFDFVLDNNFGTSNDITIYIQTNFNKNKAESNIIFDEANKIKCLTTDLCKLSTSIPIDALEAEKSKAKRNMHHIKRYFSLLFAKYLCELNNAIVPQKISDELKTIGETINL